MTVSFVEVMALYAAQTPGSVVVADTDRHWTHGELWDRVRTIGYGLSRRGVGPGFRVGTALPQNADHLATLLAIMATGAAAAPLNVKLVPRELDRYLDMLQPDLVIGELAADLIADSCSLDELLDHAPGEWQPVSVDATVPAIIFGTGGTTGIPKGATWSTAGLAAYLAASALALDARRTDVEIFFAPFFHVALATCALTTLYVGGSVRFEPRFDAEQVTAALATGEITRIFGPPTALARIVTHPDFDPGRMDRVRSVLFGSTASEPDLPLRLHSAFPRATLVTGYGATEFGAVVRLNSWEKKGDMSGIGWAVPGVELRILDPAGNPVAPGEVGELVIRAPWQMSGYVIDGVVQSAPVEGIRSGDLASRNSDGSVQLRGRLKELVITGGENVYPSEVERVMCAHPWVTQAAVLGMSDPDWGERVEAVVVVDLSDADRTYDSILDELIRHCRDQLAAYKVPKRILVRDEMPLTTAMKIDKRALKEWLHEQ